jgi:hypothetical protein
LSELKKVSLEQFKEYKENQLNDVYKAVGANILSDVPTLNQIWRTVQSAGELFVCLSVCLFADTDN